MLETPSSFIETDVLEAKLRNQKDSLQRLVLIDLLAGYYAFTNVHRSQDLLTELAAILASHNFPDYQLNYHLFSGLVNNQLYRFQNAKEEFLKAISLLKERGTVKQQAECYIDYAGVCMNLDDMEEASTYLGQASRLLKNFPDERLMARIICREGFLNLHYANYSKAIELLLTADKKITTLNRGLDLKDYYFLTLIHSGLGKIYEVNDDPEKSVMAYLKVVNMSEAMEMRTRISWHYLNVGTGYIALEDYSSAEPYFRKAIEASDDMSQYARASAYANLGHCFLEKKDFDQALHFFDRAEDLYRDSTEDEYYNFALIESWRGRLFAEINQEKSAIKHFALAYENAQAINNFKLLANLCKDVATFYADRKDFKSAYEYQLLNEKFAEQYLEEVNLRKQSELEIKYEAEKKKQETELLRLQATKLQLKALRAQMNPHFLFNALNAIQNFITSNDITAATKYLARFAQLMRQSLDYSDMEIISLEKEIEFLRDYLQINEKLRFKDRLSFDILVDDDIEEDILGVPTMIVQPYVENAIEHGLRSRENGHVEVKFTLIDEHMILCTIRDNGIGRRAARLQRLQDPKFQNYRSRGTSITEKRLQILHHSKEDEMFVETIDLYDPDTGDVQGTMVKVKIPVFEIQ